MQQRLEKHTLSLAKALAAEGCVIARDYLRARRRQNPLPAPAPAPPDPRPAPRFIPHMTPLPTLMEIVSRETGISIDDIKSEWRDRRIVRARQIFFYAAHIKFRYSFPRIGRYVRRDHSTVLHGAQRVASNREYYEPELSRVLEQCQRATAEQQEEAAQ